MKKLNMFEKSCLVALLIMAVIVMTAMLTGSHELTMVLLAAIYLAVAVGLTLASMATIGSTGSNASATGSHRDVAAHESARRKATPATAGATAAALALLVTCLSIAKTPGLAVKLVGHTAPDPAGAFYLTAIMVAWITIPCAILLASDWQSTVPRSILEVTGFLAISYTFLRYVPSFLI